MALLDKVADGKGVLVDVATGEALVGHVEEGKVLLLLGDLGELHPLLGGGIDTGRVVSAGVQEEDAALGGGLHVGNHALKVEANGVLVVVAVLLDLEAGVEEDGLVVGPRGGRDVDLLLAGVEALEEGGADSQGTSAGDGLGDGDAVEGGVLAVGELGGQGGQLGDTGDAGVLLVHLVVNDLLLGVADRGQDVGLALVIAVGTNTCSAGEKQALAERKSLETGGFGCDVVVRGRSGATAMGRDGEGRTEVDLLGVDIGLPSFGDTCRTNWLVNWLLGALKQGNAARIEGKTHTENGLLAQTKKAAH